MNATNITFISNLWPESFVHKIVHEVSRKFVAAKFGKISRKFAAVNFLSPKVFVLVLLLGL